MSPEQLTDRFIAGTTLLQNRPDGLLHFRRRVLLMQLQHLDELTGSRAFSLAVPQRLEQDLVIRRPLRPPLDEGTSTFKCPHALVDQIQIMERIDLPRALGKDSIVLGDLPIVGVQENLVAAHVRHSQQPTCARGTEYRL